MIVVSDTSALTALIQIGQVEVLARLYEQVVIPAAVEDELLQEHVSLPHFLRVLQVHALLRRAAQLEQALAARQPPQRFPRSLTERG